MPIAFSLSAALIVVTVLLHYEVLQFVGTLRHRWSLPGRIELLLLIAASFVAHIVSIALYATALNWMHEQPELGRLGGAATGTAGDFYYFSMTCYTTLGFGDVHATGPMRMVAAFEGLNGLVLITWSASFAYASTARLWEKD